MWRILDAEESGASALTAALARTLDAEAPDWALAKEQVKLIGLLGRAAVSALPELVARLGNARPALIEPLARAIGETAPYASSAERRLAIDALDRVRGTYFAREKCELTTTPDFDQLQAWAADPMERARAERLIDFADQLGPLRALVVRSRYEAVAAWGRNQQLRDSALPWERLLLAVAPSDPECAHACANLLQHEDPRVRLDAVQRLAAYGPAAAAAVPSLIGALGDGSLRIARAAALQLGALGPAAIEARDSLRAVAERRGLEQIAAAARAALDRNSDKALQTMSPGARAVLAFVNAGAAERGRMGPELLALGPSVVPLLAATIWDRPFDGARDRLRDDVVATLLRAGDAAVDAFDAISWWLDHEASNHELRRPFAELIERIGSRATRQVPLLRDRLLDWAATEPHRAAVTRALLAVAIDRQTEVGLCDALAEWHVELRLAAAKALGERDRLTDDSRASLLRTLTEDQPGGANSRQHDAARIRAAAMQAVLPHLQTSAERLLAWKALVRDGAIEQQRETAQRLATRGVDDAVLWDAVRRHPDREVHRHAR